MVMLSAIVVGWLRLRSGSVWPSAVVHATHNAAIQMFFDRITAPRAHTAYFIGEFGCAILLPLAVMAWYCMRDLRTIETPGVAGAAVVSHEATVAATR
jgi:membrane protease YdiL (CAAX protease family)